MALLCHSGTTLSSPDWLAQCTLVDEPNLRTPAYSRWVYSIQTSESVRVCRSLTTDRIRSEPLQLVQHQVHQI